MLPEIGALCLCFLAFIYWRKRPRRFPPSPFSWPIVGNMPQVGTEPYKTVLAMKKTYGDVIGIDLGMKRAVIINDYKLVKEAFNMPVFCGRPYIAEHIANPDNGCQRGIIFNSRKHSMELRRFAFLYIQSGFRNGVPAEKLILNEANELMDELKLLSGSPVSTNKIFNISVVNSLWTTMTGERYNIHDDNYLNLMHHMEEFTSSPATLGLLVFFPIIAKVAPKLSGYDHFMANAKPFYKFAQKIIDAHESTYQEGVQRDFVDSYLKKMQSTTDSESAFFETTGMENLLRSLSDIFGAGTETVSTTLRWLVFLMAKYPMVQEKLCHVIVNYKQINENITFKDRTTLPYVEAVILEVMRLSSITPLGVFHETCDDVEFHEYLIPKGTMVIANQFGIHHDPEVWGDPENFRPERFLTGDGTEVTRHLPLIAFSTGKRICPGESLARDELFIFTVKLFDSFAVEFDPNEPSPPMKHVLGTVLHPPEHKVLFTNRLL